ncbi:MAG: hypothetical protein NTZ05_20175, partial [Chloroflexi bacterium]|nr:hypothetical protein [Chloroflexota bacterium]
ARAAVLVGGVSWLPTMREETVTGWVERAIVPRVDAPATPTRLMIELLDAAEPEYRRLFPHLTEAGSAVEHQMKFLVGGFEGYRPVLQRLKFTPEQPPELLEDTAFLSTPESLGSFYARGPYRNPAALFGDHIAGAEALVAHAVRLISDGIAMDRLQNEGLSRDCGGPITVALIQPDRITVQVYPEAF